MKKIYTTPSIQVTNLMMSTTVLAGSLIVTDEETVDTPDMLTKDSWFDED